MCGKVVKGKAPELLLWLGSVRDCSSKYLSLGRIATVGQFGKREGAWEISGIYPKEADGPETVGKFAHHCRETGYNVEF